MTTPATAIVKGGFWESNGVGSLASMSGENGLRGEIEHLFNTQGLHAIRQVLITLMGPGLGQTAQKTRTRVAPTVELGGLRAIETINLINRPTVAADQAEIVSDFLRQSLNSTFGSSPPPNLDRNPLGTR